MVFRDGEGDDFADGQCLETVGQPGFRGLGDIAFAPEFGRQPPADLDRTGRQEGPMVGSGYADKADKARITDLGVARVLSKPFRIEDLLDAVRQNVRRSASVAVVQ